MALPNFFMQALLLENSQLLYQSNYPQPTPRSDEVLVRLRLAGICTTDLELVKGYANFSGVLGHEFVGEVFDASDSAWQGRRVVGSINVGCGQCEMCQQGVVAHCPNRQALGIHGRNGSFADFIAVPVRNLHAVPDAVPDKAAVFTEPLAAALRIREQVLLSPSLQTAVIGPGRLGLLIGQVLALGGTNVIMLGRSDSSLALPKQLGLKAALASETDERHFDLIVEATGNEAGFAEALRLVKPQGTIVLKSTFHGLPKVDLTRLAVDEIKVVGSRCGPFAPALRLLAKTAVSVQPLIDACYPLSQGQAAFNHAAQPGVRKILLHP